MGAAISLRADFDAAGLRRLARQSKHAAQARRLLALALIYDGGSRSDAARLGNVTLQIVRDWVLRFNANGPAGLIDGKAPGPRSRLNDAQRSALTKAIERGPAPYLDGVVRWRLCDLAQWLWEEFRVSVSEQTLSREVRALGYRKGSVRNSVPGAGFHQLKNRSPKMTANWALAIDHSRGGSFPSFSDRFKIR